MVVTATIHAAGLYTLRRWKLESTSRGLLLISTLLVPLNFLAAIALSDHRPVIDPFYITAVSVGLLAFGWITYGSGRVLMPGRWWPLVVAVMGTSAMQLWIARLAGPRVTARPMLLSTPSASEAGAPSTLRRALKRQAACGQDR